MTHKDYLEELITRLKNTVDWRQKQDNTYRNWSKTALILKVLNFLIIIDIIKKELYQLKTK